MVEQRDMIEARSVAKALGIGIMVAFCMILIVGGFVLLYVIFR